jgi:hypothetical protein
MAFISGFAGYWVAFVGGVLLFFNLGLGLMFLSLGLALLTFSGAKRAPGWAFKRAHRGSKAVRLLIAIIGLIPPFGLIYFASWAILGRAVERAAR